jgi:high affinity Mn2+ porin
LINATAQDSVKLKEKKLSIHWQSTLIPQHVFKFKSPYAGDNSFLPTEPTRTSFTTTLFASYSPVKKLFLVFNPEMAGGKGLSKTTGIAGFPNGEIYRVGNPKPQLFVARLYAEYRFNLSKQKIKVDDDLNQIQQTVAKDYLSVIAGKFALTDFFDDSQISHDPRTQFMNWSLMGNGAWDYPANVRGYTYGVIIQALFNDWGIRLASATVPNEANGESMQWMGNKASGNVIEIEKTHLFKKNEKCFTTWHVGAFLNKANMGNYANSIQTGLQNFTQPDIEDSRKYGTSKFGFYMSFDNHFNHVHNFIKGSWSDGKNETWAFTEIDRSIATGFSFDGILWKRKKDNLGIAFVTNGLSNEHKTYLANGGYGFIIGDGKLNYATENIIEAYYSYNVWKKIYISPDYQFISNPAYNKDRGPVHVFAIRLHAEL